MLFAPMVSAYRAQIVSRNLSCFGISGDNLGDGNFEPVDFTPETTDCLEIFL